MNKVVVIDYEMGNTDSVVRALEKCGAEVFLSNKENDLNTASHIILPGVGAFKKGMENIYRLGLKKHLEEQVINNKIPFLGICLGMQLLATKGYEHGENDGLGWIEGSVKYFNSTQKNERIPHIGWNEVKFENSKLFSGVDFNSDFYFVHSYHFVCKKPSNIIAKTPYCGEFVSAINKNNIYGVQFHPEKSQAFGQILLKNFLSIA